MPMDEGSPLDFAPYVFVVTMLAHFNSWDELYFTFFKTSQLLL